MLSKKLERNMKTILGIVAGLAVATTIGTIAVLESRTGIATANEQPAELTRLLAEYEAAIPAYKACVDSLGFQTEVIPASETNERTRVRAFGEPALRLENDSANTAAAADGLQGCLKQDLFWLDLEIAIVKSGDTTTKVQRPD